MFENSISFSINLYNRVVNSNFVQRLFTNRNLTEENQSLVSTENSYALSPEAQEILDSFGGDMVEARNHVINSLHNTQIEQEFDILIGETIQFHCEVI